MARLTEADKARNEAAIRAAMEQLLRGNLPPGGKVDIKTLAELAGGHPYRLLPEEEPRRHGTSRRLPAPR